ncbi:MAG: hypothetical protein PHC57_00055 [Candidatus Cloacimonetes bacterium]|nr:hypothetical protein [Candidatus Cloacimonadota bacterium]
MKKLLVSLLAVLMLLAISACSEKDNSTEATIEGYLLEQFVGQDAVTQITDPSADAEDDFRSLYGYEIVASDGFSPRNSSNAGWDLAWTKLKTGYIVPSDNNRTWFNDSETPGAFRVKDATNIRLYRKVDVEDSLGAGYYVELQGMTIHQIENWDGEQEPAIKLSDLLAQFDSFTGASFYAYDDYSKDYTPEQISDGYYLLNSEVTTFPTLNDDLAGGLKKFKKLARISVAGVCTSTNYINSDAATTDLNITLPTNYSAYEATELIDY